MSNTVPYAPSFMPQSVASTDDNGLVTDQKMIDHMMLEARVSREQALIMLNCLYQSFQHNLLIAGKAQLKDLLAVNLDAEHFQPSHDIITSAGVNRTYKAKKPKVKLRTTPSQKLITKVIEVRKLKQPVTSVKKEPA